MLVHELNQFSDTENNDSIINALSKIFDHLLSEYSSLNFLEMKTDVQKESHKKKILHKEETEHGLLLFEAIVFNKGNYTGAHTHSEYFIEKIVYGKLEEKQYSLNNGCYYLKEVITRTSEQKKRIINCPELFPHNVRAIEGNSHSFCLSLGSSKIQPINAQ